MLARVASVALVAFLQGCGGSSTGPTPVTEPPTLTCPADIHATSQDGGPVNVAFDLPTASKGAPPVTVSCVPGSGSSFPLGTNSVSCTATDSQARHANCSFSVVISAVPVLKHVKFLAFGDSVTEGTISSPCPANEAFDTLWMKMAVVAPQSYPYKLQALLAARYTSQMVSVTNEGKAGENVATGSARLPGVLDKTEPEVLLLLDGFNDLLAAGRKGTFDTEIPRIAGELEDMVKEGRSQNASVLLATLPAGDPAGCRGQGAPGIPALNDRIRRIAADEGATLVDLYGGLGGSPTGVIGIDGLHPTDDGYTKMAQVWFDAIRGAFEQPSPTVASGAVLVVPPRDRIR